MAQQRQKKNEGKHAMWTLDTEICTFIPATNMSGQFTYSAGSCAILAIMKGKTSYVRWKTAQISLVGENCLGDFNTNNTMNTPVWK